MQVKALCYAFILHIYIMLQRMYNITTLNNNNNNNNKNVS